MSFQWGNDTSVYIYRTHSEYCFYDCTSFFCLYNTRLNIAECRLMNCLSSFGNAGALHACACYILVTQGFVEHVHTPLWIVIPVQGYANRTAANRHKQQHLTPLCFPSTVILGILLFPFSISTQFSCTSTLFFTILRTGLYFKAAIFKDSAI